jgi:hypothetical protein
VCVRLLKLILTSLYVWRGAGGKKTKHKRLIGGVKNRNVIRDGIGKVKKNVEENKECENVLIFCSLVNFENMFDRLKAIDP